MNFLDNEVSKGALACTHAKRRIEYFIYDDENRPRITVTLTSECGIYCRGIAICHTDEMPNKKAGRHYANELALHALMVQSNAVMTPSYVVKKHCERIQMFLEECIYRFEYNATPTYHELGILLSKTSTDQEVLDLMEPI